MFTKDNNPQQPTWHSAKNNTPPTKYQVLRSRAGALLFCLLLSAGLITACGEKPLPAGEHEFSQGLAALESGDTAKAHELFAKAGDNDPSRPWRKLGEARRIELYSSSFGAMGKYLELISLTPDFDSAYTGYCRLALNFGKPQLAWNAVQLYARNRAINSADATKETTSASRNYGLIVAKILQLRGETEKSESRLQNLANSLPQDGEVALALASVILQQGRVEEALLLAHQAADNNSESRIVITSAISFFIDAGYAKEALTILDDARKQESSDNLWANRLAFETFLRLGYVDYASEVASQIKGQIASEAFAFYLNARMAEARGNYEQAKEWYLYSLSIERTNLELYRDAARVSTNTKNFIQMEDNMDGVIQYISKAKFPADYVADANLQYAKYYMVLRQWQPALQKLRKARSTYEGTPQFELMRAETQHFMQAKDSSKATLARLVKENHDSFEWLRALAVTMAKLGNYDLASDYIEKALQIQPNDYFALIAQIDINHKTDDSAGYAQGVENLARLYPQNKRTLRIQSDYYLSLGDNASALDIANRMIELYPGDLSAYNYAATLAGSRYGARQGLKYLTDALEQNPDIPAPYRKLASYYIRQGEVDSAETYLKKAFKINQTNEATLLTNGVFLEAKGFPDSALALYKSIIDTNPFSAEAFNNLAWVMANNDIEPAHASNFARQAVGLSGGMNGNMHGTLGWALYKEKKFKQANMAFQMAIRFSPQDAFKRFLYGSNLEESGESAKAIEQYQQALALGISGSYRLEVDKALQRLRQ